MDQEYAETGGYQKMEAVKQTQTSRNGKNKSSENKLMLTKLRILVNGLQINSSDYL